MRNWLSISLETGLAILFLWWMPRRSLARMRAYAARLRERPDDAEAQVTWSRMFIARWWILALVCALVLELDGGALRGGRWPRDPLGEPDGGAPLAPYAALLIGVAVASLALSLVLLATVEPFRKRQLAMLARLGDAWALLPRSPRALVWFAGVAVTAGVCEELAFRRLLPVYAMHLGDDTIAPLLLSVIGFGLAHRYQGLRGMVLTGVLGLLFYSVAVTTGSLLTAMCIHALVDLRFAATYLILGAIPVPAAGAAIVRQ
jgi:membrane protease YdiL (CAAX protease family)